MSARRKRLAVSDVGAWLLGLVLLIWTLAPLYNMVLVAVQEKEDVFSEQHLAAASDARELRGRVP